MPLDHQEAKVKASVFFEVKAEYHGHITLELKNFEFTPPSDAWLNDLKPGKDITVVVKEEGGFVKVSLKGKTKTGAEQAKAVGRVKPNFVPAAVPAAAKDRGMKAGAQRGGK